MRTLDELIADSALFAGMQSAHLRLIAGCARNVHAEGDAYLAREGDPADVFYLIRRGSVSLEVHGPGRGALVVMSLQAGDPVGWSWLFAPYRWQLDARTLESSSLVAFDGACLRGKVEDDHELGYQLMRRFAAVLVERLQATQVQLLDVYGDDTVVG
jgi:CRP/FNR family transcriptional regulator, cyclic AMP receptor protein